MWVHPNSKGHNFVSQFPEIFKKYEPIRFQLPMERLSDFFDSSSFLFGSRSTQDINMIFSAVQRVYGGKHEDFQSYIQKPEVCEQLLDVNEPEEMKRRINDVNQEYNSQFGMNRKIKEFYRKYSNEQEKQTINSKLYKPASYKPNRGHTIEDGFEISIDLLLYKRNKLDHSAEYIPFHNKNSHDFTRIKIKVGNKEIEWLSKLTFDDFFEFTRKAMARFWLEEYEAYLENGGKVIIDKLVDDVTRQCEELNRTLKRKT